MSSPARSPSTTPQRAAGSRSAARPRSTPIWAAMLALINASPTCAAQPGHAAAASDSSARCSTRSRRTRPHYAASFTDVTTGNNDIYDLDGGQVFPATTGYDLASGLGSPQLTAPDGRAGLAYYLCSFAASGNATGRDRGEPGSAARPAASGSRSPARGSSPAECPTWPASRSAPRRSPPGRLHRRQPHHDHGDVAPGRRHAPADAPAPQDGAGPAEVIVTLNERRVERARSELDVRVRRQQRRGAVPSITAVVPFGGSEAAPRTATILGSGFAGATKVTFGGVPRDELHREQSERDHGRLRRRTPSRTACSPLPSTGVYAARTRPTTSARCRSGHQRSRHERDRAGSSRRSRERSRSTTRRARGPARLRVRDAAGPDRVRLPAHAASHLGLDLGRRPRAGWTRTARRCSRHTAKASTR